MCYVVVINSFFIEAKMVVSSRSQQLIKTSKNVNYASKLKFSTSSTSLLFRNYVQTSCVSEELPNKKFQDVRLCFECRRFHSTDYFQSSRESRSRTALSKLTPQEVSDYTDFSNSCLSFFNLMMFLMNLERFYYSHHR